MMLNRESKRIFYQTIYMFESYRWFDDTKTPELKNQFAWNPIGQSYWSSNCNYNQTSMNNGTQIYSATGIYLGTARDILDKINNNIYEGDPKTISFVKDIAFPRSRVRDLGKYQIKRNTSEFDALIIPEYEVRCHNAHTIFDIIENYNPGKPHIYYSPSKDFYYFIDFYPSSNYYRDKTTKQAKYWQKLMEVENMPECHSIDEWVEVLKSKELIPADIQLFYEGDVVLIANQTTTNQLEYIETYNGKFMFLSTLEKIISESHPDITWDELMTIDQMLGSKDQSTVLLALNLFNSYNISKVPMTIGLLLSKNRRTVFDVLDRNVEMKYFLDRLQLEYGQIKEMSIRSHVQIYGSKMDKDSLDYQWYRKLALDIIQQEINEGIVRSYESAYSGINLKVKAELE